MGQVTSIWAAVAYNLHGPDLALKNPWLVSKFEKSSWHNLNNICEPIYSLNLALKMPTKMLKRR